MTLIQAQKVVALIIGALIIVAIVAVFSSCDSTGVTKESATTGVGISAVTTGAATAVVSQGWSIVLGFVAGLLTLFFGKSPPHAGAAQPVFDIPWGWIIFGLVVWLKGHHIIDFFFKGGGIDALLRVFAFRRKPAPPTTLPPALPDTGA